MTHKLSTGKRPIYPPAVCHKTPPTPPPTPLPIGAIYVQFTGTYHAYEGPTFQVAEKIRCRPAPDDLWQMDQPYVVPGVNFVELELWPEEKKIVTNFSLMWDGEESDMATSEPIALDLPGPFHAGPFQIIMDGGANMLTIELSST